MGFFQHWMNCECIEILQMMSCNFRRQALSAKLTNRTRYILYMTSWEKNNCNSSFGMLLSISSILSQNALIGTKTINDCYSPSSNDIGSRVIAQEAKIWADKRKRSILVWQSITAYSRICHGVIFRIWRDAVSFSNWIYLHGFWSIAMLNLGQSLGQSQSSWWHFWSMKSPRLPSHGQFLVLHEWDGRNKTGFQIYTLNSKFWPRIPCCLHTATQHLKFYRQFKIRVQIFAYREAQSGF